jgi:hypothetical protein
LVLALGNLLDYPDPQMPSKKPYHVDKKMSFKIDYESEGCDLYAFYPFEGWDSDEFNLGDHESTPKA